MLYAVQPTVPPAVVTRLLEPVDWDDSERAWESFIHRATLVKQYAVTAGSNQLIAQHRDTLRYARLRDGTYLPQVRRFKVGDFVYVRRHNTTTLEVKAQPVILQVLEVRDSGVLLLQGRDGRVMAVHLSSCAPCHLTNVDPTMDRTLAPVSDSEPCSVCHMEDSPESILLCDNCNAAYHMRCLRPALLRVPIGLWVCPECVAQGITVELAQEARERAQAREDAITHPERYTAAQKEARELDGRLVTKVFYEPSTRRARPFWGKLYFLGKEAGAHLRVVYEDGDAERLTMPAFKKSAIKLQPEGTVLPPGVTIPTGERLQQLQQQLGQALEGRGHNGGGRGGRRQGRRTRDAAGKQEARALLTSGSSGQALPAALPLTTAAQVEEALQLIMPGPWAGAHVTRLHRQLQRITMAATTGQDHVPDGVITVREEVLPLLEAVDFSSCQTFMDPFSGWGVIGTCLREMGLEVVSNDLNPRRRAQHHEDALDPAFYRRHPAQVLVASPPFSLLDLAAPVMTAAAGAVACIHVSGLWLSSAHLCRQHWLQHLAAAGRLHVLLGLPRGPAGRRNAWVLCFASASIRQRMVRTQGAWPCSYPPLGWKKGGGEEKRVVSR
jgi:hypothetical protein